MRIFSTADKDSTSSPSNLGRHLRHYRRGVASRQRALRVLHLSTYSSGGGAARAAFALHQAQRHRGLDTGFISGHDWRFFVSRAMERRLRQLQHSPVKTWRSVARFGSLDAGRINRSNADIVNLHWVTDGFLSVEEIGRIDKPVVWTMHDMWPFTGTEHYTPEEPTPTRWQEGYRTDNRLPGESGPDLDRWTWDRKRKSWTTSPHLVPVSRWLADAAGASTLAAAWPVTVIPNVMNTQVFQSGDRDQARRTLQLSNAPLIAFTASAGISDARKGWDNLAAALPLVRQEFPDIQVMVIGHSSARDQEQVKEGVVWVGPVTDDQVMATWLQAADVIAVPSTADNLPMTACEAQCVGKPVVAFNVGGLSDTVEHDVTGYLARPHDTTDLAEGLVRALRDAQGANVWGHNAVRRAQAQWDPDVVVDQYRALYERILNVR